MNGKLIFAAMLAGVLCGAQEFKLDLDAPNPWKSISNYKDRLKFETREINGKKAYVATFVKRDKGKDTAFTLVAPDYAVAGKQQISVTIQFQSWKGMKIMFSVQRFVSAIRWFDKAGKEISPMTKIVLPVGTGEIQTFSKSFAVPANAKTANLQIGFDLPDISEKNMFAVFDVQIR